MFKLCWIKKKSWGEASGHNCAMEFDTIEAIKSVMNKCLYNDEWVEDIEGNRVEMNWKEICL